MNKDSQKETILIASDHGGVVLKAALKDALSDQYKFHDLGAFEGDGSVDYPDYAKALAVALEKGTAKRGVLICGSGIGISIAANRHHHVRAALCTSVEMAKLSRQHNHANVLALGERILDQDLAIEIARAFLSEAADEDDRHKRRVAKMS